MYALRQAAGRRIKMSKNKTHCVFFTILTSCVRKPQTISYTGGEIARVKEKRRTRRKKVRRNEEEKKKKRLD